MGFESRTSFTLLEIWLALATVKLVRDPKPKTDLIFTFEHRDCFDFGSLRKHVERLNGDYPEAFFQPK